MKQATQVIKHTFTSISYGASSDNREGDSVGATATLRLYFITLTLTYSNTCTRNICVIKISAAGDFN